MNYCKLVVSIRLPGDNSIDSCSDVCKFIKSSKKFSAHADKKVISLLCRVLTSTPRLVLLDPRGFEFISFELVVSDRNRDDVCQVVNGHSYLRLVSSNMLTPRLADCGAVLN